MKQFLLLFIFLVSLAVQAQLPDLIPYRKGKLWGYCDSNKKIVIEPKYDRAKGFDKKSKAAIVILNDTSGYIDSNLVFHKATFCGLGGPTPNVKNVHERDGKWGLFDERWKQILPYQYDGIVFYTNGWFTVKKDGKWAWWIAQTILKFLLYMIIYGFIVMDYAYLQ